MGTSLRNTGVAVIVLGALLIALPYLNVPRPPGPPELGYYVALAGAALWIFGKVV